MTAAEAITTVVGAITGSHGLAYGIKRLRQPKDPADRIAKLEADVVRLRTRAEGNRDNVERLIERCDRIEEGMRQDAADAAERHKQTFEILGELRGTLRALMRDGGAE